eukprot:6185123-Amphidinium_carterae.1
MVDQVSLLGTRTMGLIRLSTSNGPAAALAMPILCLLSVWGGLGQHWLRASRKSWEGLSSATPVA